MICSMAGMWLMKQSVIMEENTGQITKILQNLSQRTDMEAIPAGGIYMKAKSILSMHSCMPINMHLKALSFIITIIMNAML